MSEQEKVTSEYHLIQDAAGLKILDRMEKTDVAWDVILDKEKVSVYDFAHWLEASEERKARFSLIRDKFPGGHQ